MDIIAILIAEKLHIVVMLLGIASVSSIKNTQRLQVLVLASFVLPLIFVSSRGASFLFENPRPFLVNDFTPLISHASDNGFPSDHALLVFAIASIVFTFNKMAGAGLFLLAVLVGVGRVVVGVHHLIDIVGSFVIATSVTLFVVMLYQIFLRKSVKFTKECL